MSNPFVLLVLDKSAAWSRQLLRGFAPIAHERGWSLLHYNSDADVARLAKEWNPSAAVLGPEFLDRGAELPSCPCVIANSDRAEEGYASVCLDEERVGELALREFVTMGFRDVAAFRFNDAAFAVRREQGFSTASAATSARLAPGWWLDRAEPPRNVEDPVALMSWLRELPKPCGIFTCCDTWARVVSRYARAASLRIPEDIALIGADNDTLECELLSPRASSVSVPWGDMGREVASLVQASLAGEPVRGRRVVISPVGVVVRRSSDVFAIDDAEVARAVAWIREHAQGRLSVPTVAQANAISRQRLERRFRAVLGRTVLEEIRRAHVDIARRLLVETDHTLPEIAKRSGFTNPAVFSVAFRRELGLPPGTYRRRNREGREDA